MALTPLSIHELGPKGDGIAAGREGRVFVDRALPGERVKARIFWDGAGIKRAELEEVMVASPHRVSAPCAHYDQCGNCSLQHVASETYRWWKRKLVEDAMEKVGLRPGSWGETVFVGTGQRRRATFTAQKSRGKVVLGYFRRRSKDLTAIRECAVAHPRLLQAKAQLQNFLPALLREGQSIDALVQLVGNHVDLTLYGSLPGDPSSLELYQDMLALGGFARISIGPFSRDSLTPVAQQDEVVATFGELSVELPSAAFLQATAMGEEALAAAVVRALPKSRKPLRLADLFSGCGTFSGRLISMGKVDAFEVEPGAVRALQRAGRGKALTAVERDLFHQPLLREELNVFDFVVLDPPRAGALAQVKLLAGSKVPTVVSISCNPATFARDAKVLSCGGYYLRQVQVVDQFLWSHHVEMVGVFEKRC